MGKTRRGHPSDPTSLYAKHKRKKTSPRLLEQGVTVDMGCSSEEKETRTFIRTEVQKACQGGYGWVHTPAKLKSLISKASFKRYKGNMMKSPTFELLTLTFPRGRPTDAPLAALVEVGKLACSRNATGDELTQLEVTTTHMAHLHGTHHSWHTYAWHLLTHTHTHTRLSHMI